MTTGLEPGLVWVRRLVVHRLASHRAALAHAEALGYPLVLSDQVHATAAAVNELALLLAELDDEIGGEFMVNRG